LLVLLVGPAPRSAAARRHTGQNAFHLVVLDDTPSMGDQFSSRTPRTPISFRGGQGRVETLTDTIAQAGTRQEMKVVLLSDLDSDEGIFQAAAQRLLRRRVGDQAARPQTCVDPHRPDQRRWRRAKEVFSAQPRGKKVFISSAISATATGDGTGRRGAGQGRGRLTAPPTGAHVSYIDVAHQYRGRSEEGIAPHSNLALEDVRAATTIAAEGVPVEFTVGVGNYSTEAKKTFMPRLPAQHSTSRTARSTRANDFRKTSAPPA